VVSGSIQIGYRSLTLEHSDPGAELNHLIRSPRQIDPSARTVCSSSRVL
jgi:hypothetical protein